MGIGSPVCKYHKLMMHVGFGMAVPRGHAHAPYGGEGGAASITHHTEAQIAPGLRVAIGRLGERVVQRA
jgi:hypothetical protein